MTDGLHAVPSRRYPHIHKRQRVRISFRGGPLDHLQSLPALKGGINHETGMWRNCGVLPQHERLGEVQSGVLTLFLAKNFPEIRMDRSIVVNDQDPVAGFGGRGVHELLADDFRGNIKAKVAPRPAPSLAAESEPPISRA